MATTASAQAGGVRLSNSEHHFPGEIFFEATLVANVSMRVLGQVYEALVASSLDLTPGDLITADYLRRTVLHVNGFETRKPFSAEDEMSLSAAINKRARRVSEASSVSIPLEHAINSVRAFIADQLQRM